MKSLPIADLPQYICQWIVRCRAHQLIRRAPRFGVEMQGCYPRSVLAAIVLLFEQKNEAA